MAALFSRKKELKEKYGERIPPGQTATEKWPVLHFDEAPQVDLESWKFRVFGEVEEELAFSYQEFTSMPAVDVSCDIHCVTHWSRMDNRFHGVSFRELMKRVKPREEACFVIVHCECGYTTNPPLSACMDDDVLWAWKHDGENLTPEHGRPAQAGRSGALFLEKREMGVRGGVFGGRPARFLGDARIPQRRGPVQRREIFGLVKSVHLRGWHT